MVIYLSPMEFQSAQSLGAFHRDYMVPPSFFPGDKTIVHDESAMPCEKKILQATCTGIYAPGEGPAELRWRVTFTCSKLM